MDFPLHTPITSYKTYACIEEVGHVELPLTLIDTPEKLRALVEGGVAFVRGDEQPLRALMTTAQA